MIEGVIANWLAFHPTIIIGGGLPAYPGGPNNLAIFAVKVPRNCDSVAIRIQSISTDQFDTQDKIGFSSRMDVSIYGRKDHSYVPLRALGMLVYRALHRAPLVPYVERAGYTCVSCYAKAPCDHEDSEGFPAAIVQVTATVLLP